MRAPRCHCPDPSGDPSLPGSGRLRCPWRRWPRGRDTSGSCHGLWARVQAKHAVCAPLEAVSQNEPLAATSLRAPHGETARLAGRSQGTRAVAGTHTAGLTASARPGRAAGRASLLLRRFLPWSPTAGAGAAHRWFPHPLVVGRLLVGGSSGQVAERELLSPSQKKWGRCRPQTVQVSTFFPLQGLGIGHSQHWPAPWGQARNPKSWLRPPSFLIVSPCRLCPAGSLCCP